MFLVAIMLYILLICLSTAVLPLEAKIFHNSSNAFGPLKFQPDGTFQISVFEDLHFGESGFSYICRYRCYIIS